VVCCDEVGPGPEARPCHIDSDAHVDIDIDPRTRVASDPVRLRRILANLFDNAVVHGGGTVHVSARSHDHEVALKVVDDGPGIADDELDKVFDRFHKSDRSRATGGSGLGLAIARQYARSQGGSLTVHNEPGHGACFTLTLPAATREDQMHDPTHLVS
jgi:signal transduction histidine kinase